MKNRIFFSKFNLPIEKSIKPIHKTVFNRAKPNKINAGIKMTIPYCHKKKEKFTQSNGRGKTLNNLSKPTSNQINAI